MRRKGWRAWIGAFLALFGKKTPSSSPCPCVRHARNAPLFPTANFYPGLRRAEMESSRSVGNRLIANCCRPERLRTCRTRRIASSNSSVLDRNKYFQLHQTVGKAVHSCIISVEEMFRAGKCAELKLEGRRCENARTMIGGRSDGWTVETVEVDDHIRR